jgi:hypothetical protein
MKSLVKPLFRTFAFCVVFAAVSAAVVGDVVAGSAPALTPALSPQTRAILDEAADSVGQEAEPRAALETLKKRPRAEVLSALRAGLEHGGPWVVVAARASQALDAKEMLPDLLKAAGTRDEWQLLAALEQLSRETKDRAAVEALFTKKLTSAPAPAKIIMIDSFSNGQTQLPASLFDTLVSDQNLGVRRAVVRQFLASRESYSSPEQARRFKLAFTMKPYQVRLEAFEIYASLPTVQRRTIASAFDPGLCGKEKNAEVKAACEKVAKGAK